MESVPAFDMRMHIGKWLRRVEAGEEIIITWRGHPVARLIPEGRPRRRQTAQPAEKHKGSRKSGTKAPVPRRPGSRPAVRRP